MLVQTPFGTFDGTSWERQCQAAFSIKYGDKYQRMPASPGDYGIEGWTSDGLVFQCYCPEKHYTQKELYEAIRGKITTDIGKLKTFAPQLQRHIGNTKICKWILVTPIIDHNKLHAHAREKEGEARKWNLSILSDDFTIFLQDGNHFALEFEQHRRVEGTVIPLGLDVSAVDVLPEPPVEFEELIDRKNRMRLRNKVGKENFHSDLKELNMLTASKFLQCDAHLASIEHVSPQVFKRMIRVIGHYAKEMQELQYEWVDEPSALVTTVKTELGQRLEADLSDVMGLSDARHTADLMVSRWLAVCQLDFTE